MKNASSDIIVRWKFLTEEDLGWSSTRCLYAYLAPDKREVLYIGKSWSVTVKRRWDRDAKGKFWDDLEKIRNIRKHHLLLGEVALTYEGCLTQELLADIESLLIMGEQPWGNIQSKNSRITRPGLLVKCSGSWPGKAKYYGDAE